MVLTFALLVTPIDAFASTGNPSIQSFESSPTSLPIAGGTITLTGTVTDAPYCTISVEPQLSNESSTVTCTTGTFSLPFTLPPDTTSSGVVYTFLLTVTNETGSVNIYKSLSVTVGDVPSGLRDPPSNIAPNPAYGAGCLASPRLADTSPTCVASAVAAIDNARASEAVPPLPLNLSAFESLTPASQVFAITNVERIDRGLQPIEYLTTQLNAIALTAARADSDPYWSELTLLGGIPVSGWAGISAVSASNALWADYAWMYDDGWGGSVAKTSNPDCTFAAAPSCWGHRQAVLFSNPLPGCYLAAGTSVANTTVGLSYVDLIVDACGAAPSDATVSWKTLDAKLTASTKLEISNQIIVETDFFSKTYSNWFQTVPSCSTCTWKVTSGRLPQGITLTTSGHLTGRANDARGTFRVRISVTNRSMAQSTSKSYVIYT